MSDVTQILQNWSNESEADRGRVIAAMYDELRRNAAAHLRNERHGDLQPTSLVNEAYMRLINITRIDLKGRNHFLGLAGRIMREILVDEARRLRAAKRDHGLQTRFTGEHVGNDMPITDILELDELLSALEEIDPIYVKLFEARAFAGMTIEEAAEVLEMSPSTVKRKWKVALAWIKEHTDASGAS
ncbi:MAG: ECF-type sigma factor [Pseudomonadaceae bacterium]|nr:ECF-type sigma factor [Pseudomonadaceae bacterium]